MNQHVSPPVDYLGLFHARRKAALARMNANAKREPPPLPKPALPLVRVNPAAMRQQARDVMAFWTAQEVLEDMEKKDAARIERRRRIEAAEDIREQVTAAAGLRPGILASESRHPDVALARFFGMWRVRTELGLSTPDVVRVFGRLDHTSALYACRKTEQRLAAGLIPQALLATIPNGNAP